MGRTRDVSKILTSNTSILTLASASSIYQTIAKTGMIEITPSTVSVTGGRITSDYFMDSSAFNFAPIKNQKLNTFTEQGNLF